jgi:hypothetical protein
MKPFIAFFICAVISSGANAASMQSAILDSVGYIGSTPSQLGIAFDSSNSDAEFTLLEKSYLFGGATLTLTLVARENRVLQVSWSAKPKARANDFAAAFRRVVMALVSRSFTYISQSSALHGEVILGDSVSHPNSGASYWASLIRVRDRIRVDISFVEVTDAAGQFSVVMHAEAPIPPRSDAAL